MKRILCWIIGHQWVSFGSSGKQTFDDARQCQRCHKGEYRIDLHLEWIPASAKNAKDFIDELLEAKS